MKKTKLMVILLITFLLIKNTMVLAKAVNIGETKYLERGEQGFYSVQYWNNYYQKWYYITYSRTFFTDNDGQERIAYCCTPDNDGIGWIPGEYDGYDTTIQYKLSNEDEKQKKLWRIFKNGYPYVSPEQLGVETEDDAYLATKQAAYFIIRDRSEDEVYDYFRPGEDYVEGQDLDETYRRGEKVIDAIYNLVYIGNNIDDEINTIRVTQKQDIQKEGNYSFQEFEIQNSNLDEVVKIDSLENCPPNTRIVDSEGVERDTFYGGESFRVIFKNTDVDKDYETKIKYTASCKNYPIFYAKSSIENTQDYLLTVDKHDEEEGEISFKINSKTSELVVKKIDEATKQAITGVKFTIEYKNGEKIGEYITDENGIIEIKNLKPENVIIKEINAPEGYIVNNTSKQVQLCYNEKTIVEIDNKKEEIQEKEEIVQDKKEIITKKLPRTGF